MFFDFIFGGTEVDEQAMFDPCGSQIAEDLGDVFVSDRSTGFEYDDVRALNEQIGEVVAKRRTVFVEYCDRDLLLDADPLFAKAMSEAVLVDFLQMSATVLLAEVKASLANEVAESHDLAGTFICHFLVPLW